jgi:hypothetical protein
MNRITIDFDFASNDASSKGTGLGATTVMLGFNTPTDELTETSAYEVSILGSRGKVRVKCCQIKSALGMKPHGLANNLPVLLQHIFFPISRPSIIST